MLASRPVDSVESSDSWNAAEEVSAAAQGSGELAGLPLRLLVPWAVEPILANTDRATGQTHWGPVFSTHF